MIKSETTQQVSGMLSPLESSAHSNGSTGAGAITDFVALMDLQKQK